MSWYSLAPYKLARSDGKASIAVQKRHVAIRLGPVILEKVGWKAGDCLDVEVGDGEDFGWIRLVKNKTGWSLQKQGGQSGRGIYCVMRLQKTILGKSALPHAPDRYSFTPLPVTIADDAISLRLPWLDKNESYASGERDSAKPFAAHNLRLRPNVTMKLDRPPTHVGRGDTLAG